MGDSVSTAKPRWTERVLPRFFAQWRSQWVGPTAADMSPSDYINEQGGLRFLIAGAWVFCPETTEYRGCIVLSERFNADNVDTWLEHFGGNVSDAEAMVNQTHLDDAFGLGDADEIDDQDVAQLALALGECWQGVISARYPDRDITVTVSANEDGSYGSTVTFCSGKPGGT
jgi:hypothetical protein